MKKINKQQNKVYEWQKLFFSTWWMMSMNLPLIYFVYGLMLSHKMNILLLVLASLSTILYSNLKGKGNNNSMFLKPKLKFRVFWVMNDWNFFLFPSRNAEVSKWKKLKQTVSLKKKNSIQCNVWIPAPAIIVDFYESVLNPICKKWFSINHAG